MSLSTLQAQLSAISGDKQPGSTYKSSRRHEEAIGRGPTFSVQHGKHVSAGPKFQASLIFPSAREAADVSLNMLQETCQQALRELEIEDTITGRESASNDVLQNMLFVVNSKIAEQPDTCGHVLEYMIRRYHVHVQLMQDFLWTFLPHMSNAPALLRRALQLVDLATDQSYLWLRPYADPKTETLFPRQLLAQNVIKNASTVRQVCRLAKSVASQHEDTTRMIPRKGIAHVLSFTAAIVVEGLSWLAKSSPESSETILRALLPTVLHACRAQNNVDWTQWGYLVASVVAETMELNVTTMTTVTTKILHGAKNSTFTAQVDALVAAYAVLWPPQPSNVGPHLRLLNDQWLGCPLPDETFNALMEMEDLVAVVGSLHYDRRLMVAPLVASLTVAALRHNRFDVVRKLLEEPKLESVWQTRKIDLIAAIAAYIIQLAIQPDANIVALKQVLASASRRSNVSCERGVANGLEHMQHDTLEIHKNILVELLDVEIPTDKHTTLWTIIPPRVALEHADAAVRLEAIGRLSSKDTECMDTDGETVVETLLRRWSMDDDKRVAFAAIHSAADRLESVDDTRLVPAIKLFTAGVKIWYTAECAEVQTAIASALSKFLQRSDTISPKESFDLLAVAVALLQSQIEENSHELCESLRKALSKDGPSDSKWSANDAKFSIVKDRLFMTELVNRIESTMERSFPVYDCVWVALEQALHSNIEMEASLNSMLVKACVALLRSDHPMTAHQITICRDSLCRTFSNITETKLLLQGIFDLSSIPSNPLFRDVSCPVIERLSKQVEQGQKGFPLVAPLLEIALRCESPSCDRLVSLASNYILGDSIDQAIPLAILSSLSLFEHSNESTRNVALRFFRAASTLQFPKKLTYMKDFIDAVLSRSALIALGGKTLISDLLSTAIEGLSSTAAVSLRELLLRQSMDAILGSYDGRSWVDISEFNGFCRSGLRLLETMADSGEKTFPLKVRWELAGKGIFKFLLSEKLPQDLPTASLMRMAQIVALMLKGVIIVEPKVVVLSEPLSSGGRSRSYSISNAEGVSLVDYYPKEMFEACVEGLLHCGDGRGARFLGEAIVEHVLRSQSWNDGILRGTDQIDKKKLLFAILLRLNEGDIDALIEIFLEMPFDAADLASLLSECYDESKTVYVSFICDFIRANALSLNSSAGSGVLVQTLFVGLSHFSLERRAPKDGNTDGTYTFISQSILSALSEVLSHADTPVLQSAKYVHQWADILTSILEASSFQLPHRTRSRVLHLVTKLCALYPKAMLPVIESAISSIVNTYQEDPKLKVPLDSFNSLVPAYCLNAAAGERSILNLISKFVASTTSLVNEELCIQLFVAFSKALDQTKEAEDIEKNSLVGSLAAVLTAAYVFGENEKVTKSFLNPAMLSAVLDPLPAITQLSSVSMLLRYAISFLSELGSMQVDTETEQSLYVGTPSPIDLKRIVLGGFDDLEFEVGSVDAEASMQSSMKFSKQLLRVFTNCLDSAKIRRYIRRNEGEAAGLALHIWQDMLLAQSVVRDLMSTMEDLGISEELHGLEAILEEGREYFQSILPAHIFLASVTALVTESGTEEIRARALRLIAERVLTSEGYAEASLFMDLLPTIVEIVHGESGVVLKQSALIAIEHMGRVQAKFTSSEQFNTETLTVFTSCFQLSATLLRQTCDILGKQNFSFSRQNLPNFQLVGTVALTGATLLRIIKARSLPNLSSLIDDLLNALSVSNALLLSAGHGRDDEEITVARMVQISVVRLMLAVVETVPQFLPQSLSHVLAKKNMYSKALRDTSDAALQSLLIRFDEKLASLVPIRLLMSPLKTVFKELDISDSFEANELLGTLLRVVEKSSNQDVKGHWQDILKVTLITFDLDNECEQRKILVESGSKLLLRLVMKLSEIHLHRLYSSLKEWKGEFDKQTHAKDQSRSLVFWTVSLAMSKELRSLFLPCMTIALKDAISELELAVELLCETQIYEKSASGTKKRKLQRTSNGMENVSGVVLSLQPLLSSLEYAFRADSHSGGNWVRAEHSSRYHSLVGPLGRLLQANLPDSLFESLVEGSSDSEGSVVACLTTLATAAGNEQLWKPLNHAILDACGTEGRSNVKRAGLTCLHSLINSLGEEYMVLIPECLPTLSELLEDQNVEIASMAKDIVTIAEDLLGESLEESLR